MRGTGIPGTRELVAACMRRDSPEVIGAGYRAAIRALRTITGGERATRPTPDPDAMAARLTCGQGVVVTHNKQRVGLFRDRDGMVHKVIAVCTHAQQELELDVDGPTWTCPRHGARFTVDGRVLKGPATEPLELAAGLRASSQSKPLSR